MSRDDDGAIDLLGTAPRMPPRAGKATPQDYFLAGAAIVVGVSQSWSALDATGRGWRFAAAVALASATGWFLAAMPRSVLRSEMTRAIAFLAASVAFGCIVWYLVN